MKCKYCDNEATVFYTKVVNGKSNKVCVCEHCAEEKGVLDLQQFSLTELIEDAKSQIDSVAKAPSGLVNASECENCGFTLDDFRKIGRLGCSQCYEKFAAEIDEVIEKMHKGKEHKGKTPQGLIAQIQQDKEIKTLEADLKKAIADEEFEDAARLRDELKEAKQLAGLA